MSNQPPDSDSATPEMPIPASDSKSVQHQKLYAEMVKIAHAELSRHQRHGTLDTRSLVHETWIKICRDNPEFFSDRKHFYATAAQAMRHVVIDYARARQAQRRGHGEQKISLDVTGAQPIAVDDQAAQLVQMDTALRRLSQLDPRLVQVVELRYFSGLEVREIAELLGVSEPTIKRDTRAAKAFLEKELAAG